MRQFITGAVAALAFVAVGSAPASACGWTSCTPSYSYSYSPCSTGCGSVGWGSTLVEPTTQYYYVNQGPTYSGPASYAPYPRYQSAAVSGWGYASQPVYYGYTGGAYANAMTHYYDGAEVAGPRVYSYPVRRYHRPFRAYRYGYMPRVQYGQRYGYAPRVDAPRYQARRAVPHYYGPRVLRRYY